MQPRTGLELEELWIEEEEEELEDEGMDEEEELEEAQPSIVVVKLLVLLPGALSVMIQTMRRRPDSFTMVGTCALAVLVIWQADVEGVPEKTSVNVFVCGAYVMP